MLSPPENCQTQRINSMYQENLPRLRGCLVAMDFVMSLHTLRLNTLMHQFVFALIAAASNLNGKHEVK